ncbi:MAG: methylenetetrahydrofolate--tRNA-(uracil(54)-C(5))-methyltransferase (FADH(2)-oxidizing) TrmFO [Candidatus Marinimicrobia bacterium]|nr:methylenetetrahydrofolate--tRNA-(uracil(54)-C(5))-methyltransferase (FADH(2)-oxidizing) TrmFO [Candidatus Neomarinimicrobiota bacterium]
MTISKDPIHIIGGGLAGCEAAWQIAQSGIAVIIHEMRPQRMTEAHKTEGLAELVCSNSFRSDDANYNAVGLLHAEMRRCGSLILNKADSHRVPAGSALAVDREGFSLAVQNVLLDHPLVTIERREVSGLPPENWDSTIVATGPLTSPAFSESIRKLTGEDSLSFFDAIAPIVHRESINMDIAWFQSRYDKGAEVEGGGADYINCPLDKVQYTNFINELVAADKTDFKEWEENTPYFEGCLPIEVMAERGPETLAHGPMKPVGLTNPHSKQKPHAVIQLRQDNALATLFNMVGFQTKLKHKEQTRIFRMVPGLEEVSFARLGGIHRNTFINAPKFLDNSLRLKAMPRLRFAGQITGCEGYVESAAVGLLAGRFAVEEKLDIPGFKPPLTTALGSLLHHITSGADATTFQPMNINFGLFPEIANKNQTRRRLKGRDKKKALAERALIDLENWIEKNALSLTCTTNNALVKHST